MWGPRLLRGLAVDGPVPARSTAGCVGTAVAERSRDRRQDVWGPWLLRGLAVDGPVPARSTAGCVGRAVAERSRDRRQDVWGSWLLRGLAVDGPVPARSTAGCVGTAVAEGSRGRGPSACAVDGRMCGVRGPAVHGAAFARSRGEHAKRRPLRGPAVDGLVPARSMPATGGTRVAPVAGRGTWVFRRAFHPRAGHWCNSGGPTASGPHFRPSPSVVRARAGARRRRPPNRSCSSFSVDLYWRWFSWRASEAVDDGWEIRESDASWGGEAARRVSRRLG